MSLRNEELVTMRCTRTSSLLRKSGWKYLQTKIYSKINTKTKKKIKELNINIL